MGLQFDAGSNRTSLLDLDENDINIEIVVIKSLIEQYIKSPILTPYYDRGIIWVDECCDWPDEGDLIYRPALNNRYIFKSFQNGIMYLAVNKLNVIDDTYVWWYHVNMGNSKFLWATLEDVINEMGPEWVPSFIKYQRMIACQLS